MTERPILFSGEMVRAILEDRKTQTRRIVKLPADVTEGPRYWTTPTGRPQEGYADPGVNYWTPSGNHIDRCPYGFRGDHLWVRETWQDVHPLQVAEGRYSQEGRAGIPGPPIVQYRTIYRADGEYPRIHFNHPDGTHVDDRPYRSVCTGEDCTRSHLHPEEAFHGWTPSIYMPRWACRLTLEITEIRVARLQDISEDDAIAEGCDAVSMDAVPRQATWSRKQDFAQLWDSLNAKRAPWNSNPWVWVVSFRRVRP